MELPLSLITDQLFTLYTAPVAGGKTKSVVEFYQKNYCKIVFISPLRALANEVYEKLITQDKHVYLAGGSQSLGEVFNLFLKAPKAFLVTTMELLSEDFVSGIKRQNQRVLFVIDEFHLFYYWGENFRPILHDRFLMILNEELPILGMTATMDLQILTKLQIDLSYYQAQFVYLNIGNQELHRQPQELHSFYGVDKSYLMRAFWREIKNKNSQSIYLLFCAYRSEVDDVVERLNRIGLTALGCVGGEVEAFLSELKKHEKNLDVIVCTTTLSHGVNLPEIEKVFINYEVSNYDFWLQMIGRGGRKGAPYEAYTMDNYLKSNKYLDRLKNKIKIYLFDFLGQEF